MSPCEGVILLRQFLNAIQLVLFIIRLQSYSIKFKLFIIARRQLFKPLVLTENITNTETQVSPINMGRG